MIVDHILPYTDLRQFYMSKYEFFASQYSYNYLSTQENPYFTDLKFSRNSAGGKI